MKFIAEIEWPQIFETVSNVNDIWAFTFKTLEGNAENLKS